MYESAEELQAKIDEYFTRPDKKPTISGLAYHLGFESRQSFYDYEQKEGFAYTIKRARLRIENEYEDRLNEGAGAGAIFALKNLGWKDQTDIKANISLEQITGMELDT